MQHIHILGISGTFMSALAILATEAGYLVTGSDTNCYPPVSDLLAEKGIAWTEGYDDCTQALKADLVIVGNAIKRGMPVLEAVMLHKKPYTSGPEWLSQHILRKYRVIAVSGTHGKTTTTAMLTWILTEAGIEPGFLIGGVVPSLGTSAKLGKGDYFIIEADEYDSAFFDKRPKFMHYRPEIAIMNNLEFDHADIYADLAAIEKQFYYFLRTIPKNGLVLKPLADEALNRVCEHHEFCRIEQMGASANRADWYYVLHKDDGSHFSIYHHDEFMAEISWSLIGQFNVDNALAAFCAAYHAGVNPLKIAKALSDFKPVKRRLEVKGIVNGVTVYDDFAHHPTAIAKTIEALKQSKRHQRIVVVMEFASYTMRTGVHAKKMGDAFKDADMVFILKPDAFDFDDISNNNHVYMIDSVDEIIKKVATVVLPDDAVLIMSNRGFGAVHNKLIQQLNAQSMLA